MANYFSKLSVIFAFAAVFGLAGACNEGTFSGSSDSVSRNVDKNKKKSRESGAPDADDMDDYDDGDDETGRGEGNDDDDGEIDGEGDNGKDDADLGEDGDKGNDDDGDISVDDGLKLLPQQCTATNGKVVSGVTECPAHNAAFTSDDGRATRVGCCPLPSRDILDKDSKAVKRGGSCQTDEIAVGADGNGFICRKINTKKYRLEAPQQVCYRGKGSSGGSGSSTCSSIIAQLQGLIALENDVDGCVAQPYGAVMTHKTGKDCKDQKASVIVEKATGTPVQMFP